MAYLIDTNVLSEGRRSRPDPRVVEWLRGAPASGLFLSVIVLGEIRRGIEKLVRRGDTIQADRLDHWLEELRWQFMDRIVPVSAEVTLEWGRLTARHDLPFVDGILAATATTHGWTLVTRNVADFDRTRTPVLNPFTPR